MKSDSLFRSGGRVFSTFLLNWKVITSTRLGCQPSSKRSLVLTSDSYPMVEVGNDSPLGARFLLTGRGGEGTVSVSESAHEFFPPLQWYYCLTEKNVSSWRVFLQNCTQVPPPTVGLLSVFVTFYWLFDDQYPSLLRPNDLSPPFFYSSSGVHHLPTHSTLHWDGFWGFRNCVCVCMYKRTKKKPPLDSLLRINGYSSSVYLEWPSSVGTLTLGTPGWL